ncbi:MAG: glucan biosynthesis glucosyltransferase, partial [Bradyrhizobium sp.]|nr:glucan biosynthesis glucosyltransferase [Bradyrhizobium sp.]
MGPITQDRGPEMRQAEAREQFLPAESPLLMSSQQLRAFRRAEPGAQTPGHMRLRRAFIFSSTVALTSAGCYEMYEVVQVGGVTILEWMVLVL